MSLLSQITDGYERKARLYPALVLLTPIAVTGFAFILPEASILETLAGIIVTCGGAFLLSQLARDEGKKKEKLLFREWDGIPSVSIFRHRDPRIGAITKARYHKKMESLVKEAKAPSADEEAKAPAAADQIYLAWSTYLRISSRDTKKYALLFQENISYGYRRNIWGLRPIGILISTLSFLGTATWLIFLYWTTGEFNSEIIGANIISLVLLALWIFRFSTQWVRIAADAYAERLVETIEHVAKP